MTTTFWLVAAALMAVGVLMLAPALLMRRRTGDTDRDAQNVAIASACASWRRSGTAAS
jgi:hypothetical protein